VYVEAIEADGRWLGFAPTQVLWSADYFPRMYELAERLVREGKAYVCDLTEEQIKDYRGTLSEPGRPSPFRDRSVDENLALLRRMKAGELPDGACVLRAKIDMASANMKMRDPLLYRIRHAHHHRSGDAWKIYPMYDYAHPLEDAIEGITHSICTLEFENNRELYDWVLDNTGPWNPRPHQYEMARLALEYTVMSKRKLLRLVEEGHVRGWDHPRMPTLAPPPRRRSSPPANRAVLRPARCPQGAPAWAPPGAPGPPRSLEFASHRPPTPGGKRGPSSARTTSGCSKPKSRPSSSRLKMR